MLEIFDLGGFHHYHAAAMSSGLPVYIQVQKAVANAMRLEGTLELSSLTRLHASLLRQDGKVNARLDFGRQEDGVARIQGQLQSDLVLQCQRCMGEMNYHLDSTVSLRLLRHAMGNEDEEEAIEISEDTLQVHELIEDELILALPALAVHEDSTECEQSQVPQKYLGQDAHDEQNPFAVLAQLKTDSTSTR